MQKKIKNGKMENGKRKNKKIEKWKIEKKYEKNPKVQAEEVTT